VALAIITFWAGYLQVFGRYIPSGQYLLAALALLIMILMVIIFGLAFKRWLELMKITTTVTDEYGASVKSADRGIRSRSESRWLSPGGSRS